MSGSRRYGPPRPEPRPGPNTSLGERPRPPPGRGRRDRRSQAAPRGPRELPAAARGLVGLLIGTDASAGAYINGLRLERPMRAGAPRCGWRGVRSGKAITPLPQSYSRVWLRLSGCCVFARKIFGLGDLLWGHLRFD